MARAEGQTEREPPSEEEEEDPAAEGEEDLRGEEAAEA
jgi:hypothetical protein